MKAAAIAILTLSLAATISSIVFLACYQPITIFPEHEENQAQPFTGLKKYSGVLAEGNSLLGDGKAVVELTFQDGRYFIASEQMAAQANMRIGGTYTVSFNQADPAVAVEIQEEQP